MKQRDQYRHERDGKQRRPKHQKPKPFGLDELIQHLGIQRWDAVMVGDGSGSTFKTGCGWGTLLFRRHQAAEPKFFCGAFSQGTNNVAEIMAYFQPLLWYVSVHKPHDGQERHIHIVTDSEYVATMGRNPGSRKHHRALWAGFDQYRRMGILLHWHWLKSDHCLYNMEADALSRESRVQLENLMHHYVLPIEYEYIERAKREERRSREQA